MRDSSRRNVVPDVSHGDSEVEKDVTVEWGCRGSTRDQHAVPSSLLSQMKQLPAASHLKVSTFCTGLVKRCFAKVWWYKKNTSVREFVMRVAKKTNHRAVESMD